MSAIICDIDGTLTTSDGSDTPNTALITWLQAKADDGDEIIIVSGRPDSRLDETNAWLETNSVPHTAVHLSDFPQGPNASVAFKAYKAKALLDEGIDVELAIDNDAAARAEYDALGIKAVTPEQAIANNNGDQMQPAEDPAAADATAAPDAPAQADTPATRKANRSPVEYRATTGSMAASDDGFTYTGYIALFDEPSSPALGFTEIIKRGAFSKSIAATQQGTWEVKAYQDHNPSLFLGTTKTGTLTLQEDERGLKAQVQLNPDVTYAADLAANLKRDGASFGASFGFSIPAKGDQWSADGTTRELLNCRLVECSILTGMQPAYPSTVGLGAVRALAERMDTEPGVLRDAIDSLINGTTDVDNLRLLRAIIERAHGAITEPEPEPSESVAMEQVEVPASIRELQLRLMRAKR
jgi:hypothetical protein